MGEMNKKGARNEPATAKVSRCGTAVSAVPHSRLYVRLRTSSLGGLDRDGAGGFAWDRPRNRSPIWSR